MPVFVCMFIWTLLFELVDLRLAFFFMGFDLDPSSLWNVGQGHKSKSRSKAENHVWTSLFVAFYLCFEAKVWVKVKDQSMPQIKGQGQCLKIVYMYVLIIVFFSNLQKERDLELAARIGQTLLEKNKDLAEKNETLEDQVAEAQEQVCNATLTLDTII